MKALRNVRVTTTLCAIAVGVVLYQVFPTELHKRWAGSKQPASTGTSVGASAGSTNTSARVPILPPAKPIEKQFAQTHMTEWMEMPRRDPFLLSNSTQAGKEAKKPSPVTQLKLNGIWRQTGGRIAAINNRVYSEGDLVEGYRIERIDADQVWFAGPDRNERLRFENYDVKALVPKGTNRLSTASGGNARIAGPRL